MGLRFLPLLAFAIWAAACAPAGPRTTPQPPAHLVVLSSTTEAGSRVRLNLTLSKSPYPISGDSVEGLRRSLDLAAVGGFDAETDWTMTWTFRYERSPGSCELATATVDLAIVVRLPQVDDEAALEPALRRRWDEYVNALETHEMGHAERATAVARLFAAALEDAAGESDCARLGNVLNTLGQSYIDQGRASDAAYDAATDHGATEGATFP